MTEFSGADVSLDLCFFSLPAPPQPPHVVRFNLQNINHFDLFGDMSTPPSVSSFSQNFFFFMFAELIQVPSGHAWGSKFTAVTQQIEIEAPVRLTLTEVTSVHVCPPRCPPHLPTRWTRTGAAASSSSTPPRSCTPPSARPLYHQVAVRFTNSTRNSLLASLFTE